MCVEPHPGVVREFVQRQFEEFSGDAATALDEFEERILLQDGGYRARSYRTAEFMAMWMIEVGILQFYDNEGNMLMTVNLRRELQPKRMAA